MTAGRVVHWNDFHLRHGLSAPENQHVLPGLAGSLLRMQAVKLTWQVPMALHSMTLLPALPAGALHGRRRLASAHGQDDLHLP